MIAGVPRFSRSSTKPGDTQTCLASFDLRESPDEATVLAEPVGCRFVAAFRTMALATGLATMAGSGSAAPRPPLPVGYIESVEDPEDLVQLPGTEWVIASGRRVAGSTQSGHLYLINASTHRSRPRSRRRRKRSWAASRGVSLLRLITRQPPIVKA